MNRDLTAGLIGDQHNKRGSRGLLALLLQTNDEPYLKAVTVNAVTATTTPIRPMPGTGERRYLHQRTRPDRNRTKALLEHGRTIRGNDSVNIVSCGT